MANGGGPPGGIPDEPEPGGGPPGAGGGLPGGAPGGPPDGGQLLAALRGGQQGPQISAPGPGDNASATNKVIIALRTLSEALPGLMGTPLHADVANVISRLSRRVSRNAQPTLGVQQTQMQDWLQNLKRGAMAFMQPPQGGPPEQGGPPPPGAQAQAPMPSTPLPGA